MLEKYRHLDHIVRILEFLKRSDAFLIVLERSQSAADLNDFITEIKIESYF